MCNFLLKLLKDFKSFLSNPFSQ